MHSNDTDQYWIVVPLVGGGKTGEYRRMQTGFNSTWLGRYTVSSCYTLHLITCLKYPRINQKMFSARWKSPDAARVNVILKIIWDGYMTKIFWCYIASSKSYCFNFEKKKKFSRWTNTKHSSFSHYIFHYMPNKIVKVSVPSVLM